MSDPSPLLRELEALRIAQEPAGTTFAGAWRSRVRRAHRAWFDCNAFVTALVAQVLQPLAEREEVAAMLAGARAFLRRCGSAQPSGGFSFWSADDPTFRACPDLDDTALARSVLLDGSRGHDADAEALHIFAPYRATRGTALAAPSSWARSFPGMFATWMHDGRCVIDLAVNANVLAYLHAVRADIPGMNEAESALRSILAQDPDLEARSPYYRSRALVLWRCALALRAGARIGDALRSRLRSELTGLSDLWSETPVWLAACAAANVEPPRALRDAVPAGRMGSSDLRICTDLTGLTAWTSRDLSTALRVVRLAAT